MCLLRLQHRQHKKEAELEDAKSGLQHAGKKLGGWFGKKAEEAKDVASDAKVLFAACHTCAPPNTRHLLKP